MKQTRQEEKLLRTSEEFTRETGIVMKQQAYGTVAPSEKALVCLVRGLLIFLVQFGITGLFITSFELPCNAFLIYASELLLSVLIAFLYYNKWLFNLGYIFILILFIAFAIFFREIANSGFNAILNIILNVIDERMNLDGVRQYTEQIANRELTVTVCLLMVSFFGVCYFNSTISGYMSPFLVFLQTYPLLQICIYLDDEVNYFFAACIVGSWVAVCLIRRSGRFRINLKPRSLFFSYRKKCFRYEDKAFSGSVRGLFYTGLMISIPFLLITLGIAKLTPSKYRDNESTLEAGVDSWVENFALNGMFGFFNSYQATGGISGGRLGGVRSVAMDFQTDLEVTYVPYTTDTLYLKGYVGEYYTSYSWEQTDSGDELKGAPYYFGDCSELVNKESLLFSVEHGLDSAMTAFAKMTITNIGAEQNYYYMPYYTAVDGDTLSYIPGSSDIFNGDIVNSLSLIGESYSLNYYADINGIRDAAELYDCINMPDEQESGASVTESTASEEQYSDKENSSAIDSSSENTESSDSGNFSDWDEEAAENTLLSLMESLSLYSDYVKQQDLQVPKSIRSTLEGIIEEYNLDAYITAEVRNGSASPDREMIENTIELLRQYFKNNFTYSLNPGKTPDNKDFAVYFLTRQKNGYCAHFATAGCLLLRTMGIPARYVEGYAFDINSATDVGVNPDENAEDWYEGDNPLGSSDEQSVLTVSVTDASAHAWVEVYYEGFGWEPAEFTVADEEETETQDFWSQFRSLLSGNNEAAAGVISNITGRVKESGEYIVLGVFGIVAVIILIWYLRRFFRMLKIYYRTSNKRLVSQYQALAKLFRKYGLAPEGNLYHEDMRKLLKEQLSLDGGVTDLYIDYIVKASFGRDRLSGDELSWSTEIFKNIIRLLRRKLPFKDNMILLLKY